MGDTSVQKVMSENSPNGEMGQKYLASGVNVAMRLWENEEPTDDKETRKRDYETVGYVVEGKAELHSRRSEIDSWKKAIRGLCRKARNILIRFWKLSPQSKRLRRPPTRTDAMKNNF